MSRLDAAVAAIVKAAKTGKIGDGKVFVSNSRGGRPHPDGRKGSRRGLSGVQRIRKLATNMKTVLICFSLLLVLAMRPVAAPAAEAAAPAPPAPKLKAPSVEERLADLEAYVNNGARGNAANTNLDTKIAGPGPGHNGCQMICAALVLFMTLPGLALFYGGLVRRKNVLSVLAQCLGIAGLVTILWWLCGYSLAFSKDGHKGVFGNLDWRFLAGVDSAPNTDYGAWVSHNVFSMYQLMFAIITPALIVGAIAERMKFSAVLLFVAPLDVRRLFSASPHGLGRRTA